MWQGIAADIAYHSAWFAGRRLSQAWGVNAHLPACGVATGMAAFGTACIHVEVDVALSVSLAACCPWVVHWFGQRSGQKPIQKRPAARVDGRAAAREPQQRISRSAPHRYDEAVWGKAVQAGVGGWNGGTSVACLHVSGEWDLGACRRLLTSLSPDDLRSRLDSSPWMLHGGEAPNHMNWLKEAAVAFAIPLRTAKKVRKPKPALVAEVATAVEAARGSHGAASSPHEARDYARRSARLVTLRTRHAVAHERVQMPWASTLAGMDLNEAKEELLLWECPEDLRLGVVSDFARVRNQLPQANAASVAECTAARYLHSALARMHVSTCSGEQLSSEQLACWQAWLEALPDAVQAPAWPEDPAFLAAVAFFGRHGHLGARKLDRNKRAKLTEEAREEDQLARDMEIVRRAKVQDVVEHAGRKRNGRKPILIRRKLSASMVAKWEQAFSGAWQWLPARSKECYIPGCSISCSRHEWAKVPYLGKAMPCYLCGAGFDCKAQLLRHWRASHLTLMGDQGGGLSDYRVEEEMRKRIFHGELYSGPFELRGEEMRRIVGTHATHQTHSSTSSGCINHSQGLPTHARALGGCAICARSFWVEDLHELHLFTKPAASDQGVDDVPSGTGAKEHTSPREKHVPGSGQYCVQARCAEKVNQLLDIRRYHGRFPKIPKHELYASSVQHPHVPGWRWLLHTHRVPHLHPDSNGEYPPVPACRNCAFMLSGDTPQQVKMPRYALADDNWMGRMPFALAPGGQPLGEMTLKTLARGRMCVNKVIAEPERCAPPNTKQGGLRGNSIAFPQARLELMQSNELPPPPEEASRFMRESVIIALAGAEKEQLHNAKWAEIPRQQYVDAARFCTSHSTAYEGMIVNEATASKLLGEKGRTSDAVLQQAVPVLATQELQHRLEGPADTGCAGVAHEQVSAIDGRSVEECSDDEGGDADNHSALPVEDFPENAMPTMHFCADALSSGDLDELQALRKVHAELAELQKALAEQVHEDIAQRCLPRSRIRTLQQAVQGLIPDAFTQGIIQADSQLQAAEHGQCKHQCEAYAVHTQQKPLSMYSSTQWAMCFPHCFPYGDGVFGLPRVQQLSFQQWAHMLMLREELIYELHAPDLESVEAWFASPTSMDTAAPLGCTCLQCRLYAQPFRTPRQPRWGRDRELVCCLYDSWRRMEQIRLARAHVRRSGYHSKLERICSATPEMVDAAMRHVGEHGSVRDVLQSSSCDPLLKEALSELMVFTTEVVGSDGARARLRHEQNGYGLAFGPSSGFLTPNFTDVRSPLVVLLHGGGLEERYEINLLDECPRMPCAREMLQLVSEDPVAQARYFILSIRLFCEHVLGSGPFDDLLRHNGWCEGPVFPDGFAASGLGGAFGMLAAFHGPVEEQARLSLHPHMPLWCISTTSEAWLRSIVRRETKEAQDLLRGWQERVLAAVQSMQLDSAAVLPLLLSVDPAEGPEPRSTPFTEVQQGQCRFDGGLDGDARDPAKRRPLVGTEEAYVDQHVRAHVASLPANIEPKSGYNIPLTGAQQSRMPRYRELVSLIGQAPSTDEERRHEAEMWKSAYVDDYRQSIAVGQMHVHKQTCFKYVVDKGVKKAKHCRFQFCHFVSLAVRQVADGVSRVRDIVFARTGKEIVLPRRPGEAPAMLAQSSDAGEPSVLRPTCELGPSVITDDSRGLLGRIRPVRWNPLEGSSSGPAQVSVRGNTDFQSMLRTFPDGFRAEGGPDKLRDALPTEAEWQKELEVERARFEADLPGRVAAIREQQQSKNLPVKAPQELTEELRAKFLKEDPGERACRGVRLGDRVLPRPARRFKNMVRNMIRESMASSIATMFYACDYATKPNMVCAPLLVALRDGLARLEAKLREESERERVEQLLSEAGQHDVSSHTADAAAKAMPQPALDAMPSGSTGQGANSGGTGAPKRSMSKLEREACRRLLRQATAAQQAQVKGNCLMIMQMLTRREVVRSHLPWQLMTKHAMWMAFEHRRQLEGLPSRPCSDPLAVTMLEASVANGCAVEAPAEKSSGESDESSADEEAAGDACGPAVTTDAQDNSSGTQGAAQVNIRRRNDTFYDDYLHRGWQEVDAGGKTVCTPLVHMSYLEYGAYVRIVLGDPWTLRPNQYAFVAHHSKFHTHIQELRQSPAVPFIHGFTMPSVEKDAETNACFKQLLLRPHVCRGPQHCMQCDATFRFCTARLKWQRARDEHGVPEEDLSARPVFERVRLYSYVPQWHLFESRQLQLAERADQKIKSSKKYPVLPDTSCMREFWLPGAIRNSVVHEHFVPLLRAKFAELRATVLWDILRLAGWVRTDVGQVIGIAGTEAELARVQAMLGKDCGYTGPGFHDEQLTIQEFLAWRRVEYAARLDFMAEARGRPRPGREHPDAVADDPDGTHGGSARDDEAAFDEEVALPGAEEGGFDDESGKPLQVDPQLAYQPRYPISEDEVFDTVHRLREAQAGCKNTRSQKKRMFETFMHEHEQEYGEARRPRAVQSEMQSVSSADPAEIAGALKQQAAFAAAREKEEMATSSCPPAPHGVKRTHDQMGHDLGQAVQLAVDQLPLSPKEMAARLIAQSGVWRSKEQYLGSLFVLQPLQEIWEKALASGRADALKKEGGLLELARGMQIRRVFLHGPGGSGKTFCMTEVVVKVVRHFLGRRGVKAIAASNSAARLLLGKTMHQAGKMRRQQSLKAKNLRPDSKARKALEKEWADMFLLLGDELSLASPPLLAGISRRAFHGRSKLLGLRQEDVLERTFGDVPTQVLMGDFMQLNPVKAHTLIETFAKSRVPGVPHKTAEEDEDGYATFRSMCANVILFSGTHRFLDTDLPQLLEIMRTPGGRKVPDPLRRRIAERIQAGPHDPRIQEAFVCEGVPGFFCFGAHAAIQWEQVMRMTQLHVLRMAKQSRGPHALQNTASGEPSETQPSHGDGSPQGQLVYYFQRVDRFKHEYGRQYYEHALRSVNLSKSAGLHGLLGIFLGMRVRLTKKILAPELVQEASGEVVGISFHPEECFGHPASSSAGPAPSHPCWQSGRVLCERLPLHVEVRFDGCADDYTGLGKPGVWHLAPKQDTWKLPLDAVTTINHPGAFRPKRVKASASKDATAEVTSCQLPLTHEDDMTFQNIQGKTVRGPRGEAKGLVLDMFKPGYMGPDEYFQHIYMGLGRARKLSWLLLRSFPLDADGELDWSTFEAGPPEYLCEFLEALESRARRTYPKLLRAQREFGLPAFEQLPQCATDPENSGRFIYNPVEWGFPARPGDQSGEPPALPLRKRRRSKGPDNTTAPGGEQGQVELMADASPGCILNGGRAPATAAGLPGFMGFHQQVASSVNCGASAAVAVAMAPVSAAVATPASTGVSGALAVALAMPTDTPAARLRRRFAIDAAVNEKDQSVL